MSIKNRTIKKAPKRSGLVGKSNGKPAPQKSKQISSKQKSAPASVPAVTPLTNDKPSDRNNDILVIRVPTDLLNYLGMKAVEAEHERAEKEGDNLKRNVGAATMARNILMNWIRNEEKRDMTAKK